MHILNDEIKGYMNSSVLCWLATSSDHNIPNVSPKEVFTYFEDSRIIIANIKSPQSVKNIRQNKFVSVSFIDIFVQKGFQIKGLAEIVSKSDLEFSTLQKPLLEITKGVYPFHEIISILVTDIKPIIAPNYVLFPETTEEDQIQNACESYHVIKKKKGLK